MGQGSSWEEKVASHVISIWLLLTEFVYMPVYMIYIYIDKTTWGLYGADYSSILYHN